MNMNMFLGKDVAYWLKLQCLMEKYRLTEKDFDRIDGALSMIRNQGVEDRLDVIEKRLGL